MIKSYLAKVADRFSDLPERDPTRPPLNPPSSHFSRKPSAQTSGMGPLCVPWGTSDRPSSGHPPRCDTEPWATQRTQEGFDWSEDRGTLYEGPFLLGGGMRRAVAASAELRGGCTSAWTPSPLLMPLLHCTGQDSPQHPDSAPDHPDHMQERYLPCPSSGHTGCCAFRVPLPACADAAALSICLLGASAKLTCTLSGGYSSYYVGWHQKVPGRGPLPDASGHQWCCWTSGMGSLTAQARALA